MRGIPTSIEIIRPGKLPGKLANQINNEENDSTGDLVKSQGVFNKQVIRALDKPVVFADDGD